VTIISTVPPTPEERRGRSSGGAGGDAAFKSSFGAPPRGGWFSFAEESIDNKRAYCEKHGYSFFLANDLLEDPWLVNATLEFDRDHVRLIAKRRKLKKAAGRKEEEAEELEDEDGSTDDDWQEQPRDVEDEREEYQKRAKIVRLNVNRKPSWLKVKAVERYLASGDYDWVFWIDGDTVIMNDNVRLESFLPEEEEGQDVDVGTRQTMEKDRAEVPSLILTKDHRGINAGVWFMRRSEWSMRFLAHWWSLSLKVCLLMLRW